ncbi:MAG: SpoIIE family protein phosphatase [Bryobacterales bacterium]|nr:SpoIIE family protein phosphatase [Bryobacterales bacterium]MDE0294753.1 SpoIIE family protein phosphatase [Bryobacterales bacterium]MDE0434539.1 SpoIIE family protein phosphatase [Bryobacterales bacterium]
MKRLRLAARVFIALAGILTVAVLTTSATLLYNTASALRDEAEAAAVHLAELLSGSFAEMGEISLANVARTLDATLDGPMTAQARIAAHLTEAAEAAGYNPPRINRILDEITQETVLDEFWITDEEGFSYLTNVRDEAGVPVPFRFDPDPAVQPQASKFYVLLDAPLDGDDFITQPAQVREIDQEVYKYVGVGGVDKPRIVQVGNALAFGEQEILTNVYASQRADVSAVIEGILGQHMRVQATMLDHFVSAAEAASWTKDDLDLRLRSIVDSTAIGEIRVTDASGVYAIYSSLPQGSTATVDLPHAKDLGVLVNGSEQVVEHATAPHASDGSAYKYVTVARKNSPRLVQVGVPIESSSGNLLYSVYQKEADILVRSRNLQALWIVNLERELAAAAPRPELQTGEETVDVQRIFEQRTEAFMKDAMDQQHVVSAASLSLLSPEDRGIWVASPIVNDGGILIGGLGIAVSLDEIALKVQGEARNTALIAFLLLGLTAVAALFGTRLLTHPIEIIADAARQVESGEQPDRADMESVSRRSDEIGSLARVFSDMTVQVFNREEQLETLVSERTKELQTSNQHLRLAQEAIDQDLKMAKVVQAALVREGSADLGTFSAYARMTPAQQVGGDFVDIAEPSDGMLFLAVGDVSGKGVAAALFMAASQAAVKSASAEHAGIDAVAEQANSRLCSQNPMGLFVTCVLARVNLNNGVVDYVCAGHEPAYLISPDDSRRPLPMTGGLAMGLMEEFGYASRRETLQPGETLFLYTDGLTDATNRKGELFGKERLEGTLNGSAGRSPEDIVNHVWSEIGNFSAGTAAADDMTCLVLHRR